MKVMTVRDEAHRLIDAVPEERIAAFVEILRQWAGTDSSQPPLRRFRTTAIFDGEPDLGARSKAIIRSDWDADTEKHSSP
jgi:hypothetical protein